MADEAGSGRTLVQVLGLYVAVSWGCLQVVDLLAQNIPLPSWVFLLTLALLAVGLPITAATAYLQGRASGSSVSAGGRGLPTRLLTWPNVLRGAVTALALWGVAVTGWLLLGRDAMSAGEVLAEVETVEELVAAGDMSAAFDRVAELDSRIGDDSLRLALWDLVSGPLELNSEPPGATVLRRAYDDVEGEWVELGRTPLSVARVPFGVSRLRIESEGMRTREVAAPLSTLQGLQTVRLDRDDELAEGMVRVSGQSGSDAYGLFVPGLEQAPNVSLGEFLMSAREVTNREYEAFVSAGGYDDPTCWPEAIVDGTDTLSFAAAVERFTDRTGRPGPATWDVGSYLPGTGDHPVGGVSWYEAAAYAC